MSNILSLKLIVGQYASSAMSTKPLPNPRAVLTELLSQLQQATNSTDTTSNPLKDASPSSKNILLTFHVLYPNEFLSALDLLDRCLLTRYVVRTDNPDQERESAAEPTTADATPVENNNATSTEIAEDRPSPRKTPLYFVRSAQQPRSYGAGRTYDPLATHYEVRPAAWNCSCPALAFAAFPGFVGSASSDDGEADLHMARAEREDGGLGFGGLGRGNGMPPACKHLLACVLVEQCDMFKGFVEQKEVSAEEIAGWCVGWGD